MFILVMTSLYVKGTNSSITTNTIEFNHPAHAITAGKQWVNRTTKGMNDPNLKLTYLVVENPIIRASRETSLDPFSEQNDTVG